MDRVKNGIMIVSKSTRLFRRIQGRKVNWLGHIMSRKELIKTMIEGIVEGTKDTDQRKIKLKVKTK